jgi:tripartite-type tricarboxylate transporter receptor subunit TctC
MLRKSIIKGIFVSFLALLVPLWGVSWGAEFPTRQIDLLIPYAPGAQADACGRSIAAKLMEYWNQPVIPINKPGASGALALSLLAKYAPDGYAISYCASSALVVVPICQKVSYNSMTDFTYLCKLFNQSPMVAVRADAPWKTWQEFIDYAEKNPQKVKYGSWGEYSSGHIAMTAIGKEKSIQWAHVPFKGDAPCVTALLGGHIDVATFAAGHVPNVRAGKLRGLLMLQGYRSPNFPNIPCMKEVGIKFQGKGSTETISGMIGPKGMPKEIIKKYETALERASTTPEFMNVLNSFGCDRHFVSGNDFRKEVEQGYTYVSELVKKLDFQK